MSLPLLQTERLILRPWEERDRAPFAALNADSATMEHFPAVLTRAESDAHIDRARAHFERHGFSFCAVEHRESGAFIGQVGLAHVSFEAPFTPAVEIGWRVAREFWGLGYAPEAAAAALAHGFGTLGLREIVAFTIPVNRRSRRVMEKLGMTHDPRDDFEHPRVAPGHPMRPHVLYRIGV